MHINPALYENQIMDIHNPFERLKNDTIAINIIVNDFYLISVKALRKKIRKHTANNLCRITLMSTETENDPYFYYEVCED